MPWHASVLIERWGREPLEHGSVAHDEAQEPSARVAQHEVDLEIITRREVGVVLEHASRRWEYEGPVGGTMLHGPSPYPRPRFHGRQRHQGRAGAARWRYVVHVPVSLV